MAKLKINELKVTGSELFEDSETFLTELTNEEMVNAMGGAELIYPTITYTTYTTFTIKTTLPYTIVIL
jgi:hypothetical protein